MAHGLRGRPATGPAASSAAPAAAAVQLTEAPPGACAPLRRRRTLDGAMLGLLASPAVAWAAPQLPARAAASFDNAAGTAGDEPAAGSSGADKGERSTADAELQGARREAGVAWERCAVAAWCLLCPAACRAPAAEHAPAPPLTLRQMAWPSETPARRLRWMAARTATLVRACVHGRGEHAAQRCAPCPTCARPTRLACPYAAQR